MEVYLLTEADEGLISDENARDTAWTMLLNGAPYQTIEGAKDAVEQERRDMLEHSMTPTPEPLTWTEWDEPGRSADLLNVWRSGEDPYTDNVWVIRLVKVGA